MYYYAFGTGKDFGFEFREVSLTCEYFKDIATVYGKGGEGDSNETVLFLNFRLKGPTAYCSNELLFVSGRLRRVRRIGCAMMVV